MSTPAPPKPAPHHEGKSWSTSWYDESGKRHCKRFGKVKDVKKKEADARYRRWFSTQWQVGTADRSGELTVRRLCVVYGEHAKMIYMKNGKPTTSIAQVEAAINAMIDHHGDEFADDFSTPKLTKLAEGMIDSEYRFFPRPRILSTSTINGRIRIIKQMFRWARGKGLVQRDVAIDVSLAQGLRAGRTRAKSPVNVKPVPADILEKTLAQAPQTIRDMIQVQLLTGMRPGELVQMRPCDINKKDKTAWEYTPRTHKTEHHGKIRAIPIGKRAQEILAPYIAKRSIAEPLFLPADAHHERLMMIDKPDFMAYQTSRSRFKPGRAYNHHTYRNAIQRSADRAFDPKGERRLAHDYSHRWHPHQLRHNFATEVREQFGLEAAADVLGHSHTATAEIYAERSMKRAKKVARKVG